MIADDNKKNKEEVKDLEVNQENIDEKTLQDIVDDDYQVILDDRGLYKVNKKWFVKIRRINVKEMIQIWGIISSTFGNLSSLGVELNDPRSWLIMFVTALPIVPGKFYQFLAQVMELQFDETLPMAKIKTMRDEYNDYLRADLKTEELFDVISIIYKQEKERFEDLIKKALGLFKPMIEMLVARSKK